MRILEEAGTSPSALDRRLVAIEGPRGLLHHGPDDPAAAAVSGGLDFVSASEERPGTVWADHFAARWPAYRAWMRQTADLGWPSRHECIEAFALHMPELLPLLDDLVTLVSGGDTNGNEETRFLSLWCPAPFLTGCSQMALQGPSPVLIRNYDHRPDLCEGTVLRTSWTGRPVMAMTDCAWGVLDGMNADGLAVSLSFGGRRAVGRGFGIPVVLRYVLETCGDVASATAALRRLPVHMAYNVTVLDATGNGVTVQMSPDRTARVLETPLATNHQTTVEWPEYARAVKTLEREDALRGLLRRVQQVPENGAASLREAFLRAPLYAREKERGWQTIYTSRYHPAEGAMELSWPGSTMALSFESFESLRWRIQWEANSDTSLTFEA